MRAQIASLFILSLIFLKNLVSASFYNSTDGASSSSEEDDNNILLATNNFQVYAARLILSNSRNSHENNSNRDSVAPSIISAQNYRNSIVNRIISEGMNFPHDESVTVSRSLLGRAMNRFDSDNFSSSLNGIGTFSGNNSASTEDGSIFGEVDQFRSFPQTSLPDQMAQNTDSVDETDLFTRLSHSNSSPPRIKSDIPETEDLIFKENIPFDTSDTELLNIFRSAASEFSPFSSKNRGEYIDPEDGSLRLVYLPIVLNTGYLLEDERNRISEKDSENRPGSDRTVAQDLFLDDDSSSTQDGPQLSVLKTPLRAQASSNNFMTQNRTGDQERHCSPIRTKNSNSCTEAEAELIFAEKVSRLTEVANRRVNFPDQDILFERVSYFSSSKPLESTHLLAFEFEFGIFYDLVMKCPKKYFLPALALSLQQDEDFPKFLKIFYGITEKDWLLKEYQEILIEIILNMKRVSNSAYEFFSNSRNAVFVFYDFYSYPLYYGKFAHHIVANMISKYKKSDSLEDDYTNNNLRQFILNFDYYQIIESLHNDAQFARNNLKCIFSVRNMFRDSEQFDTSIYKLFKYVHDGTKTKVYTNLLLHNDKVKKVLEIALKNEDFPVVQILFKAFKLESKNLEIYAYKLQRLSIFCPHLVVNVKKINDRFCIVEIKNRTPSRSDVSMILPLF